MSPPGQLDVAHAMSLTSCQGLIHHPDVETFVGTVTCQFQYYYNSDIQGQYITITLPLNQSMLSSLIIHVVQCADTMFKLFNAIRHGLQCVRIFVVSLEFRCKVKVDDQQCPTFHPAM